METKVTSPSIDDLTRDLQHAQKMLDQYRMSIDDKHPFLELYDADLETNVRVAQRALAKAVSKLTPVPLQNKPEKKRYPEFLPNPKTKAK